MAEVDADKFAAFLSKVPDAPPNNLPGASAEPADPKAEGGDAPPEKSSSDESGPTTAQSQPEPAKTPTSTAESASAPDLDAVKAALKSGDLDALAELLDEDPALYDEKTTKWAARNRREAKLKAERDATTAKAARVVERWAPVADEVEAITQRGEYARVFELVEALTGEPAAQVWTKALQARGPADPRVPVLAKRAQDAEARAAAAEAERAKRADEAFYETLRDEVDASSLVRQIDGWEAKVAEVLRESLDPELGEPKLSVRQAADRVLRRERAEFEKRAKVFGGGESPAKPARSKTPERASGASGAKTKKLSREEWLAARSEG